MGNQLCRLNKPFLIMAISLLLITACYQPVIQKPHISQQHPVECRVIKHELGETCVPLKPRRIIALDPENTLDPLVALGIKPIGFGSYTHKGEESLHGVSLDEVKGATNVGNAYQPSLEKILMLKPDLILSTNAHQYKLLTAIAPTVPVPYPNYTMLVDQAFFKENLRYVAKIVGKEAKAEEVLNQYQIRIEELKKRIGNHLEQVEISVLFHTGGYIWTTIKGIQPISPILTDIGIRHKFALPGNGGWNLSIEKIGEYDSDILFIVDVDRRGASFYFQNPIFSSLKAFKNNRVYFVDKVGWYTLGISGANKTLDDLFKYLPYQ
ncbi:iron-siderophore ABC transporter substrate-binding protein [Anabaena sp. FACHB-709]|uniref:ABC transporter, iron(III) dicitrate-binding protein n=2 Tax=Nostocaceae TaxID=1162 RepID=A0A1Z4KFM1_ANAVA|nr:MULTISPECIES: iron-siderophore ABC transporter substrate-binding protein [Nostocaceae]RUR88421.1 putative ABC transporter substrate-binding lipoprotein YhfQ [Nostoc sp. PCC 7120 = FACHB-418]BAB73875.1 iron(III) dicitrate-binding protein of ABC transporter [Nostoc sp. PCC 7120 = FACHB-418]BAY67798.1 ABC transporter, iron(III) dicitrate-binding protein [Trichormus variabilis NIES-23]